MKLSELPEDKLKVGLSVVGATGRIGTIYEIDKEDTEGWMIWIKWWDSESMSYKEKDVSGVRPYQGDKISVKIPECCYECSYEKPEEHCEWTGTEIHIENDSLFCPPGHCPLRRESWPKPSEDNFEEMAEEDPEKLSRWIKSETLGPGHLTFVAEVLGKSELHPIEKEKTLLPLLRHPHALAREGAIYGLESVIESNSVRKHLEKVAESDSSGGVKSAAKEALEDYEEN